MAREGRRWGSANGRARVSVHCNLRKCYMLLCHLLIYVFKKEYVVRIENIKNKKSLKLLESELRLAMGTQQMGEHTANGGAPL